MAAAPATDSDWIALFLDAQAAELGAARNTQLAYGRDLKDAMAWLARRGSGFGAADRAKIEAYIADLEAQGLARATRARRLSSLRQLYRFAHEEGWRADNPTLQITGPARQKKLPDTLSIEEVDALLSAARSHGRSESDRLRNTCLMELLYATGMRVSELVTLPVAAVRGDPQMVLVKGKGGKERMVPLSPPARAAITAWLAQRDAAEDLARTEHGAPPSPFLFPSRGKAGHLTRMRFFTLVKELSTAAGIDPSRVTPHVLRHAFATHLLQNGADLRAIQTLLGHADIATTEIYTHILDERLRRLVLDHHPLAGGSG
ncbi:site-specific tyrosine recombinase XerD [Roseibacterium beibuensis]|uniref:Tyrosine recombinase XerD n=1 Tax=[Roseibacterium] beibuensis TaxID=1193142 RepID=A0ABP9LQ60_9RHOB|nr:site-specific tyrosine recombinase XerD [Roseibacterium beibuensis]MCS6626762.1 site-specific tyrosine recombinase XerD [Roseibacterium beibuensis]